jgi:anti-sigma factor RsiW
VSAGEMACQELVELVSDYLEERLDAPTRARFEAHLRDCEGCSAYLEQLRTTIRLAGRLDPAEIPDHAMRSLSAAFRSWHGGAEGTPG